MESNTEQKRWQDLGNILLGAWLFISPWVMDYVLGMPPAAKNSYILGLAIVIFAAVAVYIPQIWEEWINVALGLWLVASPWVLGFAHTRAMHFAIGIGIAITFLAALDLWLRYEAAEREALSSAETR